MVTKTYHVVKKKILIWGDAPVVKTGFGIVANNLFSELYKNYEVFILGINYFGLQQYDTSKYFIYPIDRTDMLGLDRMGIALNNCKPDVVLLFQDVFNIDFAVPIVREWNPKIPVLAYFPIDGSPVNMAWKGVFDLPDKLITYTQWGIDRILDTFPEYKDKNIQYLYHGVDQDKFRPMNAAARKKFKEEKGWDNKFVIFSNNRFQPRKMVPLVIRGHALFSKGYKECSCGNLYLRTKNRCDLNGCGPDKIIAEVAGHDDALLYIHANAEERMMGPGKSNLLQAHILNAGFQNEDLNRTLAMFGGNIYANPLPEEELNVLYNVVDVNVSTALGEGVGLSLIEALATGTTSIAPNHSSIPEMLGNTGHIVNNRMLINIALDNGHMRPVVDMKFYLEALEIEYQKWIANGRRKVFNQAAVDRVNTLFQWSDKREKLLGWIRECSE
jgi:glycosyltransferase involved in cell wall biosynthesis